MSTAQTFYGIDFLFMGAVWLSPLWLPIAFAWRTEATKKKKLLYVVLSAVVAYGATWLQGIFTLLAISYVGGPEEIDYQLRIWREWGFAQTSAPRSWFGPVAEWLLKYWYLSMLSLWQALSGLASSYLL